MYKFFINRPIVSIVISIIMVIVGVVAMLGLPTALFPNITPPEVQVKATYVGADALTVEQSVATPIEQQMSGVDNMNYMYSNNANNGQTDPHCKLRCENRSEYRSDSCSDAPRAGNLTAPNRCEQLRRNRSEVYSRPSYAV